MDIRQNVHDREGNLTDPNVTTSEALAILRRRAGTNGDVTAGKGRISGYSKPFRYGEDNTPNLIGYATRVE